MKLRILLALVLGLSVASRVSAQAPAPASEAPAAPVPDPVVPPAEAVAPAAATPAEVTARPAVPAEQTEEATFKEEPLVLPAPVADSSAPAPELTAAELESMGLDMEAPGLDTNIHFSGFSDFTVYTPINPKGPASVGLPRHSSFYVGNFNLYASKNLSESFRTMAEVRFTYLPNGSPPGGTIGNEPQTTTVFDYAETNRVTRWGGIIMQRVYLEWSMHRLAVVRAGQFLTPYGIWNVDHGSPAYIPVQRPYAVNSNYFPERQTGLEIFGRWDASNESTFGYHLTLSNGVGPVSEYKDLDDNKAIGGRLYWESHRVGYFRLGTYVNAKLVNAAVRELRIDGKLPTDPGYLLAGNK